MARKKTTAILPNDYRDDAYYGQMFENTMNDGSFTPEYSPYETGAQAFQETQAQQSTATPNDLDLPAGGDTIGNGVLGHFKDSADAGWFNMWGGTARFLGEFTGSDYLNKKATEFEKRAAYNTTQEKLEGANWWANAVGNAVGSGGAAMAEAAIVTGITSALGMTGGAVAGAMGVGGRVGAAYASKGALAAGRAVGTATWEAIKSTPALGRLAQCAESMWGSTYGKMLIGQVAGSPFEGMAEAGNLITEMREQGFTDDEIRSSALKSASYNVAWLTVANMLEAGVAGKIAKGFNGVAKGAEATDRMLNGLSKTQIAGRMGVGAVTDALGEGMEEYGQNLIGNLAKGEELNYDEALEAGKMGAAGGLFLGGVGQGFNAFDTRNNRTMQIGNDEFEASAPNASGERTYTINGEEVYGRDFLKRAGIDENLEEKIGKDTLTGKIEEAENNIADYYESIKDDPEKAEEAKHLEDIAYNGTNQEILDIGLSEEMQKSAQEARNKMAKEEAEKQKTKAETPSETTTNDNNASSDDLVVESEMPANAEDVQNSDDDFPARREDVNSYRRTLRDNLINAINDKSVDEETATNEFNSKIDKLKEAGLITDDEVLDNKREFNYRKLGFGKINVDNSTDALNVLEQRKKALLQAFTDGKIDQQTALKGFEMDLAENSKHLKSKVGKITRRTKFKKELADGIQRIADRVFSKQRNEENKQQREAKKAEELKAVSDEAVKKNLQEEINKVVEQMANDGADYSKRSEYINKKLREALDNKKLTKEDKKALYNDFATRFNEAQKAYRAKQKQLEQEAKDENKALQAFEKGVRTSFEDRIKKYEAKNTTRTKKYAPLLKNLYKEAEDLYSKFDNNEITEEEFDKQLDEIIAKHKPNIKIKGFDEKLLDEYKFRKEQKARDKKANDKQEAKDAKTKDMQTRLAIMPQINSVFAEYTINPKMTKEDAFSKVQEIVNNAEGLLQDSILQLQNMAQQKLDAIVKKQVKQTDEQKVASEIADMDDSNVKLIENASNYSDIINSAGQKDLSKNGKYKISDSDTKDTLKTRFQKLFAKDGTIKEILDDFDFSLSNVSKDKVGDHISKYKEKISEAINNVFEKEHFPKTINALQTFTDNKLNEIANQYEEKQKQIEKAEQEKKAEQEARERTKKQQEEERKRLAEEKAKREAEEKALKEKLAKEKEEKIAPIQKLVDNIDGYYKKYVDILGADNENLKNLNTINYILGSLKSKVNIGQSILNFGKDSNAFKLVFDDQQTANPFIDGENLKIITEKDYKEIFQTNELSSDFNKNTSNILFTNQGREMILDKCRNIYLNSVLKATAEIKQKEEANTEEQNNNVQEEQDKQVNNQQAENKEVKAEENQEAKNNQPVIKENGTMVIKRKSNAKAKRTVVAPASNQTTQAVEQKQDVVEEKKDEPVKKKRVTNVDILSFAQRFGKEIREKLQHAKDKSDEKHLLKGIQGLLEVVGVGKFDDYYQGETGYEGQVLGAIAGQLDGIVKNYGKNLGFNKKLKLADKMQVFEALQNFYNSYYGNVKTQAREQSNGNVRSVESILDEIKSRLTKNAEIVKLSDSRYQIKFPNTDKVVNVNIPEHTMVNVNIEQEARQAHQLKGPIEVLGYWESVTGDSVRGVLNISQASELGDAGHEVMHMVLDLFATDKEKQALFNHAQRVQKLKRNKLDTEEYLVDSIMRYQENDKTNFGKFINKMKWALAQIESLLTGEENAYDVYEKMLNPETQEREINDNDNESVKTLAVGQAAMQGTDAVSSLKEAKQLLKDGKSDEEILDATGWLKQKDGKWRYEIIDEPEMLDIDYLRTKLSRKKINPNLKILASTIYPHSKLWNLYSDGLKINGKELTVDKMSQDDTTDGTVGRYNPSTNTIFLNMDLSNDEIEVNFIHELQHAIQTYEGFAVGTNADESRNGLRKYTDDLINELSKYGSKEKVQELADNLRSIVDQYSDDVNFDLELDVFQDDVNEFASNLNEEDAKKVKDTFKDLQRMYSERLKSDFDIYEDHHGEQEARAAEGKYKAVKENSDPKVINDTIKTINLNSISKDAVIVFDEKSVAGKSNGKKYLAKEAKTTEERLAGAITNHKPTTLKEKVQAFKNDPMAYINDLWKNFYINFVDKNDVFKDIDKAYEKALGRKLKQHEKIYGRAQGVYSSSNGTSDVLIGGSSEDIVGINKRLQNVKLKHLNGTMKQVLENIKEDVLDKASKDFMAKYNFKDAVEALGSALTWRRLREMTRLTEVAHKQWEHDKEALAKWQKKYDAYKEALALIDKNGFVIVNKVKYTSKVKLAKAVNPGLNPLQAHNQDWVNAKKEWTNAHNKWRKAQREAEAQNKPFKTVDPAIEMKKAWEEKCRKEGWAVTIAEPSTTLEEEPKYKLPNNLTREELDKGIESIPEQFLKACEDYYDMNDNILCLLEDAGNIDSDLHELLNTTYREYCPLQRDFSETQGLDEFLDGFASGSGIGNVRNMIKEISKEGSDKKVINPLETTLATAMTASRRAERNRVGQKLVKLADVPGMQNIVERVQPVGYEKDGTPKYPAADPKQSTFTVIEDGKKVTYHTSPEYYQAIVGYDTPASNIVWDSLSVFAQFLRTGATMTPSFIVRNGFRDSVLAGYMTEVGFKPIIGTINGIRKRHIKTGKEAERNAIFKAMGFGSMTRERDGQAIYDNLQKQVGSDKIDFTNPFDLWRAFKDWFVDLNEDVELGTRRELFGLAMDKYEKDFKDGKITYEDLIQMAAEVARFGTTDFTRSGIKGQQINRVSAFFNANVQGVDLYIAGLKNKETRARMLGFIATYIGAPCLAIWAANHDKDWWKELDPQTKYTNFCVSEYFRVPLPQEAGVMFGGGLMAILDMAVNEDPKSMGVWAHAVKESLCPNPIPTVLTPIMEWQANYNFFKGRPIVNQRLQKLPDDMQYDNYTTELSKLIGKVANLSPKKLDNTVKGVGATLGMQAWDVLGDALTMVIGNDKVYPDKDLRERVFVRDFNVTESIRGRYTNDFYDLWSESNKLKSAGRTNKQQDNAIKSLNAAQRVISKLNKEIREIGNPENKKFSPAQKQEMLTIRREKIKKIAKEATDKYGKYF